MVAFRGDKMTWPDLDKLEKEKEKKQTNLHEVTACNEHKQGDISHLKDEKKQK